MRKLSLTLTGYQSINVRVAVITNIFIRFGQVEAELLEDDMVPHLAVDLGDCLVGVVMLKRTAEKMICAKHSKGWCHCD